MFPFMLTFAVMELFYVENIEGSEWVMNAEESKHIVRVLRHKAGDHLQLTDGKGILYKAVITDDHIQHVTLNIEDVIRDYNQRKWKMHLAVAPTKNIDRFEWMLEKVTEIGVDEITPLICRHSERKDLRVDRLNKILISAMKQSKQTWLPVLHQPKSINEFLKLKHAGQKLICSLQQGLSKPIVEILPSESNYTILIGPEGDFSKDEIEMATKENFQCVELGHTRLRTETAAVVACTAVALKY